MKNKILIIGLGYVGLPLAKAFSKKFFVTGYDIDRKKVFNIKKTFQLNNKKLNFTSHLNSSHTSDIYIVTVQTPLKKSRIPDLTYLIKATKEICKLLKRGDTIIYESTVYPGTTEEVLIPLIKKATRMVLNKDYFVGYSPERINPGDKKNKLTKIRKIVSGSNKKTTDFLFKLYSKIITAGIHKATSIKTAEAAKILENVQRDINISLINEIALIFDKLDIKTPDVLKAASTKWNFLNFTPGLVGGHCISVDPYYLKYKAELVGYKPHIISSGRDVNEKMSSFIISKIFREIKRKKIKIAIFGVSYKENCGDIRNSQVLKIINYLMKKKIQFNIVDPNIKKHDLPIHMRKYFKKDLKQKYDVILLAVPHKIFLKQNKRYYEKLLTKNSIIFDVKNSLNFSKLRKDIKLLAL